MVLLYDVFNSQLLSGATFVGEEEFPQINGIQLTNPPNEFVSFDKWAKPHTHEDWLHFYVYDKRFQRLSKHPDRYVDKIKTFGGVIGIDHSVYRDLPLIHQKINIYQNRLLDYYLEKQNIKVLPNISWGDFRSYKFCCLGIPQNISIAVSSYGCIKNKINREHYIEGFYYVIEALKPYNVFHYGTIPPEVQACADLFETPLVKIPSRFTQIGEKETF